MWRVSLLKRESETGTNTTDDLPRIDSVSIDAKWNLNTILIFQMTFVFYMKHHVTLISSAKSECPIVKAAPSETPVAPWNVEHLQLCQSFRYLISSLDSIISITNY